MSLAVFVANLDEFLAGQQQPIPDVMQLSGTEGRHAVTVTRIKVGEQIALVDGFGQKVVAEVTGIQGKETLVAKVLQREQIPTPVPEVVVFQALPKASHAELAIDLLTQGGVDQIVPWAADRCVTQWADAKKAEKGRAKWQQAALAAAKQSRRATIPQVTPLQRSKEMLQQLAEFDLVCILHEHAVTPLQAMPIAEARRIALIIGPEGGLTDAEVAACEAAGGKQVLLGREVLRTASAGFAALAVIGSHSQRWSQPAQGMNAV